MPSLYQLKPRFQSFLRPSVQLLWRVGVTPNEITLGAMVLSLGSGACVALFPSERWPLILLGPALIVRMGLNAIDGMLAREHELGSSLGVLLNEIGDVISDAGLYLPLALVPGFDSRLVVISVLLSALTEMTGVLAIQIGASRSFKGPMGKSDRAVVFGALSMLIGLGVPPGHWVNAVLLASVILLCLTVCNRGRGALLELRK